MTATKTATKEKKLTRHPKLLIWRTLSPYDGCYWEYNVALSYNGKLFEVYLSGKDSEYETLTVDNLGKELALMVKDEASKNDSLEVMNINDKEVLESVDRKTPYDLMPMILKSIENNSLFSEKDFPVVYFNCGNCGTKITDSEDIFSSGEKGTGGIGISHTGIECQECNSNNTCCSCGERHGEDHLTEVSNFLYGIEDKLDKAGLYDEGYCLSCTESDFEYRLKNKLHFNELQFGNRDQISRMRQAEIIKEVIEQLELADIDY